MRETALKTLIHYLVTRPQKSSMRMARHITDAAEHAYHFPITDSKKEALIRELSILIQDRNESKIISCIRRQFQKNHSC